MHNTCRNPFGRVLQIRIDPYPYRSVSTSDLNPYRSVFDLYPCRPVPGSVHILNHIRSTSVTVFARAVVYVCYASMLHMHIIRAQDACLHMHAHFARMHDAHYACRLCMHVMHVYYAGIILMRSTQAYCACKSCKPSITCRHIMHA